MVQKYEYCHRSATSIIDGHDCILRSEKYIEANTITSDNNVYGWVLCTKINSLNCTKAKKRGKINKYLAQ